MVNRNVIITIAVVVTLIVVAIIVIPTAVVLSRKNNDEPGPNGPAYTIKTLRFAQTHVIPAQGLNWKTRNNQTTELHLVGERDTLVLVEFEDVIEPTYRPRLQVWLPTANNQSIVELATTIDMNLPIELPPTESNGTMYGANNTYSVRLPAKYVLPRMQVTFKNNHHNSTEPVAPIVGFSSSAFLYVLPFYLFGADDNNSVPFDRVKVERPAVVPFIYQQWPVSKLSVVNHGLGKMVFKTLVQHETGYDARVLEDKDEIVLHDGFKLMGIVLNIISGIFAANGDAGQNKLIWSPLMALNNQSKFSDAGGGLGGGKRGTGSVSDGVMIHEIGHAQGLPHAGEWYDNGGYPYVNGSLIGSAWGFNMDTNEFLTNLIPTNSSGYKNCNTSKVMLNNKCVKQDPMQSGSGTQAKGYPYAMFADFNVGKIQNFFEGDTVVTKDGAHSISALKTFVPETKSYIQWDSIDLKNVPFNITNSTNGMNGMDAGMPVIYDVPVYTVFIQYINAPTSACKDCSIIYPLVKWTGNLLRHIDPTDPAQIAQIPIDKGPLAWYCQGSGCDFTLRVTYTDNSKYVKLLQEGVRKYYDGDGPVNPACLDPKDSASTFLFVENIPANKDARLVELLWTPYGYNTTTQANAKVLVSKSF
ncbi:hypothetical protein SAMD00019534_106230 [Acytostelium subglobosum LB1]|uniref:hypothetical protein n=1 Tax=Acytostelium subglobosum LB1 TaxID=1410327 RepID=UPI000644A9DA|nr:hypothetical protein SAMD00019534_106230 [Acytostelium subglobosum LB1]GAM27447.1 hypothetical protein SAMD00019534_106230 [Acytostelium subglobosum LB1]|eukprot:XP_012749512.1 hypothetical protein SAMD00019534_106230 [Acytostelium subglobosum LB1]